jgi:hypothetical protein
MANVLEWRPINDAILRQLVDGSDLASEAARLIGDYTRAKMGLPPLGSPEADKERTRQHEHRNEESS